VDSEIIVADGHHLAVRHDLGDFRALQAQASHQPFLGKEEGIHTLADGGARKRLSQTFVDHDDARPSADEVSLCLNAQEALKKQNVEARVISMPSWKLFEDQDEAYRESVLPSQIKARVSVEQAARFGGERYVGIDGARVGMRTFGESAPLQKLIKKFGFTVEDVVAAAIEQSNSAKE
jgi:Transketolase, C-terminal domain